MPTVSDFQLGDMVNLTDPDEVEGVCTIVAHHHIASHLSSHMVAWKANDPAAPQTGGVGHISLWTNQDFLDNMRKEAPLDLVPNTDQYGTAIWVIGKTKCDLFLRVSPVSASATGAPVNDHICPHCSNNRVSRSERLCWKCGGKL